METTRPTGRFRKRIAFVCPAKLQATDCGSIKPQLTQWLPYGVQTHAFETKICFRFPKRFLSCEGLLSFVWNMCTQTTASQKDNVQLHPIPIIGEFADEWVCDVLGPTLKPTARRRNKHILFVSIKPHALPNYSHYAIWDSNTSYEISLNNERAIKHVNCLRPLSPRQPPGTVVAAVVSEEPDSELPDNSFPLSDWSDENTADSDFRIGTHLSDNHQSEIRKLLASFPDVFSTTLGCTNFRCQISAPLWCLWKRKIRMKSESPILFRV